MQVGLTGLTGLASCGKSRQASDISVKAGPFVVTVPEHWSKTAMVDQVPIRPVYLPKEWEEFQKDKQHILKPDYQCRPRHWALRFPAALPEGIDFDPKNAGNDPTAPQILIHKADEWGLAFTDGEHGVSDSADVPLTLRKNMDAAMADASRFDSPAFMDASPTFNSLKRRVDFSGGRGIRWVTQWTIEPALMKLGQLHYLFLGMSDDNSCQIIATFPLNLPGLPTAQDNTHLGHKIGNHDEFSENYHEYVEDAKKWLETNQHEITPSLQALDQVMRSLVVSRWQSS